jgi:hypothetical protein
MQLRSNHTTFGRFLRLIFFLALSSSSLLAQKLPEIDAYGGFSRIRFNGPSLGFSDYSSLNGWAASITAPHLYEELGVTLNASGNYGSQLKVYNFLLGPQFSIERGRLRLFGNVLFGKAETKVAIHQPAKSEITSVGRAIALGGGLDLSLAHHISLRVIDADYIYSKTFSSNQNHVRLSAGLVYEFGRK